MSLDWISNFDEVSVNQGCALGFAALTMQSLVHVSLTIVPVGGLEISVGIAPMVTA